VDLTRIIRYESNSNNKSEYDKRPLTDGERRFLDQNIARGGGIVVRPEVQKKSAWRKEARDLHLCINCAGPGHHSVDCKATKQRNQNGGTSSLNAIFPGADPLNFASQL
jgi:hypothetical protein